MGKYWLWIISLDSELLKFPPVRRDAHGSVADKKEGKGYYQRLDKALTNMKWSIKF